MSLTEGAPPDSSGRLADKTALVTGASSGIGRATALAAVGAHVYLTGRSEAALREAAGAIAQAGGTASIEAFDVRDHAALRRLIERTVRETGRLNILVNSAGLAFPDTVLGGQVDEWREMLEGCDPCSAHVVLSQPGARGSASHPRLLYVGPQNRFDASRRKGWLLH